MKLAAVNYSLKILNFIIYFKPIEIQTIKNDLKICFTGSDGSVSAVLLWGGSGVFEKLQQQNHMPSHLLTPGLEPGPHKWQATAF